MLAILDLLEAKKRESFAGLRAEERDGSPLGVKVRRLDYQLKAFYTWAVQQSKASLSVREVFELWDKMVAACDAFIDYARELAVNSPVAVSFDALLDLRVACDEKREFHRCA